MNASVVIGILDNPWVVLIILLVTALSSWLSKRRETKEAEVDKPPVPPAKPPREFDLEEAMRELLGGEASPKPRPTPPPIPPPVGEPEWELEGPPPRRAAPPPIPPPPPVAMAPAKRVPIAEVREETEGGAPTVSLADLEHRTTSAANYTRVSGQRARKQSIDQWRDRRNARQAFVASLVFGPPKGLEP